MFLGVQVMLRNAMTIAQNLMKLSTESYNYFSAVIDTLSEKRYVSIGLGQDLAAIGAGLTQEADRISNGTPGALTITSNKYEYTVALLVRDVVIQGQGVTWELRKTNDDASVSTFDAGRLPVETDNMTLVFTIAAGGYFQKAAVLQEIVS